MNRSIYGVAAAVMAVAGLAGCSSQPKADPGPDKMAERALGGPKVEKSAKSGDAKIVTVNSICPIGGHEFKAEGHSAALTREYNGMKIGFCCDGCTGEFDSMSDAEKAKVAALAKANKPGME